MFMLMQQRGVSVRSQSPRINPSGRNLPIVLAAQHIQPIRNHEDTHTVAVPAVAEIRSNSLDYYDAYGEGTGDVEHQGIMARNARNAAASIYNRFDPNDPHTTSSQCRRSQSGALGRLSGEGWGEDWEEQSGPNMHDTNPNNSRDMALRVHNSPTITQTPVVAATVITELERSSDLAGETGDTPLESGGATFADGSSVGSGGRVCMGGGSGDAMVHSSEVPIAVANAVPSYWSALQPSVIPAPSQLQHLTQLQPARPMDSAAVPAHTGRVYDRMVWFTFGRIGSSAIPESITGGSDTIQHRHGSSTAGSALTGNSGGSNGGASSSFNPNDAGGDIYERERILLNLYHRSRFVRVMSLIDMCFLILFGAFVPLYFAFVVFPVCGYWGARRWKHRLLFTYTAWLFVEIIGTLVLIVILGDPAFILLRLLQVFVGIVVARYTLNLASYILVMNAADLDFVKNSTVVRTIEKRAIC